MKVQSLPMGQGICRPPAPSQGMSISRTRTRELRRMRVARLRARPQNGPQQMPDPLEGLRARAASSESAPQGTPVKGPPSERSFLQTSAGNGDHGEGAGSGKLQPKDYPKFVQYFRHASPYIAGHRGRTFVIVIPGNVSLMCRRRHFTMLV